MKVIILCGGMGTRIRDVSENIPKPMVSIGRLPILWHIMKSYAQWGHSQFVLCLGYKGNVIRDFFLNYEAHTRDFTIKLGAHKSIEYHTKMPELDWEVTLAETGLNVMTGARIKKVKDYFSNEENFMLTYGDGLSDINLDKLLAFHKSHGKILTVSGMRPPGRFGEIIHTKTGTVTAFNEKPQVSGGRVSGGFFVCRKELFSYLGKNDDLVFERDPMQKLVKDNQLKVYEHDGFWQPMDTSRDYQYLNDLLDARKAPWVTWE